MTKARLPKPEPRAVAVECDGTRIPVATDKLAELSRQVLRALKVPRAMISITFVSSRKSAMLN